MEQFSKKKFNHYLKTDRLGKNLVYFDKIDSTNNYALKLIKEILPSHSKKNKEPAKRSRAAAGTGSLDGLVILAGIQDKGRGRFNRKWVSPAGGLWFTIILKTALPGKDLPKTTLIAAYSIAETLDKNYGIKVNIKWPNDIYFQGKKLAGILAESEKIADTFYLVSGMGINVNNDLPDFDKSSREITSIKGITGKETGRESLLAAVLAIFEKEYLYFCRTRDFKTIFKKIEKILI